MKWPWHRHRWVEFPTNPTVCTPEYDPSRWTYRCRCGATESPLSVMHNDDGSVAIVPPYGWEMDRAWEK